MSFVDRQKYTKDIYNQCLKWLARREYSRLELFNRLKAKGYESDGIEAVLDDLVEQGWQSDARYAESYARYRIKQGFGPLKINYELQQNGVHGFDIDAVMLDCANSWVDLVYDVYAKKYDLTPKPALKEWAKRTRFLIQRGFSGDHIRELQQRLR